MIERTIILPVTDNEGNFQLNVVQSVIDEVIDLAGGASVSYVDGYWKDEGKLYTDLGNVKLTTTVDDETDKRLYAQLPGYCARLKQLSLYTHKAQVDVEFIECPASLPQAA